MGIKSNWYKPSNGEGISEVPTLSYAIFRLLRHRILSGYYKRGERLSEVKLSEELNTSRSPIREAFGQLEKTGLVNSVMRKGIFVFDFTDDDVREVAELRILLEQHIVRVLVEEDTITDADIVNLQRIIESLCDIIGRKDLNEEEIAYGASQLDLSFHLTLAELANRPVFLEVVKNTLTKSRATLGLLGIKIDQKKVIADHRQLVEALQARDLELALAIVEKHVRRWLLIPDSPDSSQSEN